MKEADTRARVLCHARPPPHLSTPPPTVTARATDPAGRACPPASGPHSSASDPRVPAPPFFPVCAKPPRTKPLLDCVAPPFPTVCQQEYVTFAPFVLIIFVSSIRKILYRLVRFTMPIYKTRTKRGSDSTPSRSVDSVKSPRLPTEVRNQARPNSRTQVRITTSADMTRHQTPDASAAAQRSTTTPTPVQNRAVTRTKKKGSTDDVATHRARDPWTVAPATSTHVAALCLKQKHKHHWHHR